MYILPLRSVATLRAPRAIYLQRRRFASCPTCPAANPLFHLQAFSNSRESRWLAKGSGLSPIEHSAQLQLIRSSEGLDPYTKRKHAAKPILKPQAALPKNSPVGKSAARATLAKPAPSTATDPKRSMMKRLRSSVADKTAVSIGRAVLARHAAQRITFKRRMRRLDKKARKFYRRLQERTILIVLSIAAATGCAVWTYDREKKLQMRETVLNVKEAGVMEKKPAESVADAERRLEALYTTPEVHELLEWQRALGALEAIEAQEIQNAYVKSKAKPWWHRLFWS